MDVWHNFEKLLLQMVQLRKNKKKLLVWFSFVFHMQYKLMTQHLNEVYSSPLCQLTQVYAPLNSPYHPLSTTTLSPKLTKHIEGKAGLFFGFSPWNNYFSK